MKLIDIGLNLMHKSYNKDRQDIIKNGVKGGVEKAIITVSSIKSSIEASEFASKYPGVLYSTAGVHPHDAKTCDENTLSIRRFSKKRICSCNWWMRPIPPERLMVETDCSFLIPRDLKPKPKKHRNEPKYLPRF